MMSEHEETDRKYDVDDDVPWVDLSSLPDVSAVEPTREYAFAATYYDTDRLALAHAGITLRRSAGGSDAGWHVRRPRGGGGDRIELGEPLGGEAGPDPDAVPEALLDWVRAWIRDREVGPVATVQTRRTGYRLIGESGVVLVHANDDVVTARAWGADGRPTVSHWRGWEIDSVDGPSGVIEAAGKLMTKAGAAPPQFSGELERALGSRVDRPPTFPALDGHSRAADVLRAHLADQTAAMLAWDGAARHDEPDGVHKMRVATRRLRSALATFRPLVDRGVTDPIRDELKWIAAVLGGARDAEVLRERLLAELSTEPDDLVLGPISTLIEAELRAAHRAAHDRLVAGLISPRYYRLLDRLDALVADPPFTPLADGPADTVVTKLVRGSFKRLRRLVKAEAPEAATERERDHRYHEIRKAAKRLRYAVEAVEPAFGAGAHRLATAAENIQEVLGEHQDSVVARQALRELGVRIHLDGENAFTIARLHALEQTRADDSAAEFASAWAAASDKRLRRWLTG